MIDARAVGRERTPRRNSAAISMVIAERVSRKEPACASWGGGNREPLIIVTNSKPITMAKKETKQESKQNKIELPPELQGKKFRIRKLTPRECFRLMGVDDADIDKIQASGLSNSAQYKLAGNSIVVDVLFHIFRKLFIEPEQEVRPGEQFSLF